MLSVSLCSFFREGWRRVEVSCRSQKARLVKSGRIGANTGVQFFPYTSYFDI